MTREVLLADAHLVGHHAELVWLGELLERPHDSYGASRVFAVKDADHGEDDSSWAAREPLAKLSKLLGYRDGEGGARRGSNGRGPHQVVSASRSPAWVCSPTQGACPSGRMSTGVGAGTAPSTGSSHWPVDLASRSRTRSAHGAMPMPPGSPRLSSTGRAS